MEIDVDVAAGTVSLDNISGTYSAQELRDLIHQLIQARAELSSDSTKPHGEKVIVVPDGYWFTELFKPDNTDTVFMFLLPGLGWTGVTLPPKDRITLAAYLMNQQLANMTTAAAPTGGEAHSATSGGSTLH